MQKWEPEIRAASTLALSQRPPLLNLLGTCLFSAIWLPQVVDGMNATCILLLRHSVVSDPLRPHGLQLARLPCPSPSPRACSYSCPLSQWCHPTISSSVAPSPPPPLNLAQHQGLFPWVGPSHQGPKDWNFSLSISPSNEYSGLISFGIDWFDLLAVQGTLKSLLQYYSQKLA